MHEPTLRLTRSMLFVPASRPDMIAKAARSAADAVCIDLEDSVAPDQKEASRANVVEALRSLDWGMRVRLLRINALDTPFAYRDVVEVVEAAGIQLDIVMLPKANGPRDIQFLDTLLTQIEARMGFGRRIGIEAQIETASGFLWLREIAASSPRLEALIFGPGDYAASLHMPLANIGERDEHDVLYPGHRWHAVMHGIVAAARANGLRCMDGPSANFKDTASFEHSCRVALALGFDGKQCIHPAQLAVANTVFAPAEAELNWARAVVAAYEQANAAGRGAISIDGKMIDAANVRMAQTIVGRQARIDGRATQERAKGDNQMAHDDTIAVLAQRHGFSADAVRALRDAMQRAGGRSAQFNHPELGGMGQWMAGGALMIGDMFNNALKARVAALCADLAGSLPNASTMPTVKETPATSDQWWAADLGTPAASGAQNGVRYAYFSSTRRLAVERAGRVSIYDTGDHQIGGVAQQQGVTSDLTFTSQHGPISLDELSKVA